MTLIPYLLRIFFQLLRMCCFLLFKLTNVDLQVLDFIAKLLNVIGVDAIILA